MIDSITGTLLEVYSDSVLISVGSINLKILIPPYLVENMIDLIGTEITLYTHISISLSGSKLNACLMGFIDEKGRSLFNNLTQVPKIGDRSALSIINIPPDDLANAINSGRIDVLKSIPGVGLEKARQIITTLAGKIVKEEEIGMAPKGGVWDDARKALSTLGLSSGEIEKELIRVRDAIGTPEAVEDIIKVIYKEKRV
ncbi:MAG: Holliday junction branch migration protein RuvA [bacterium]